MLKEKYELKFKELEKENCKYFVVGSPTNLKTVKTVEGDTFKEIWNKLWDINEIDKDRYWEDNEKYDEEKDMYLLEAKNYQESIEEYISRSNDFYYYKLSWK